MKGTFLSKIALISVFSFSFVSTKVSASDMKLNTKNHTSESKDVKVNFDIPDSYTFTIPESVDIDYPSLEGSLSIKVNNSYLPKDCAINVMVKGKNNDFKLTSTNGNSIPYKLVDEGNKEIISGGIAAKFTNEKDNLKDSLKEKKLKIKVDEKDILYSGDYSDNMTFDFAINKIS